MESKTYILFGNEYKCETERIEYFRMYNAENEIYKSFIQCEGVEECLFGMENIYELVLEQCIDGYIKGQVTARIINTTTGGLHSWSYVKI